MASNNRVYVLTVGHGDNQRDVGVFSALLLAQQATSDHWTWEEGVDDGWVIWEAFDPENEISPGAWVYEYEVDRRYGKEVD